MTTESTNDEEPTERTAQAAQRLIRRLDARRRNGEDRNDVIERLLDETIEEVPIETVIDDVFDHFDHVASIAVDHTQPEEPSSVQITVYTGDIFGFEYGCDENVPLYSSGRSRVVIESSDGERFTVPFHLIATSTGPSPEMIERTPVYMSDNVLGAEPLSVEAGLDRLRSKLGKTTTEIRTMMYGERSQSES